MHEEKIVLTSDEIKLLVDTTTIMEIMGFVIDPRIFLDVVNEILKKRIKKRFCSGEFRCCKLHYCA